MNMLKPFLKILFLNGLSAMAFASQDSFYCPQHSGFIKPGMTTDEVIAACGMPISQQDSNKPVMQKVPVKQLHFNNQGQATAFYGVWAIPGGASNYGEYQPFNEPNTGGGTQLQVDIINDEVHSIKINGTDSNAFSICGGVNISSGDPLSKVLGACGSPTITNNTYINVPVQGKSKPQIWIYQAGQYQPPVTLIILDGHLISIN